MVLSVAKYFKIYNMFLRYSLMQNLAYPVNFMIGLIIEFGYQASYIISIFLIYTQTDLIGGWNRNEILLLLGIDILVSEFITGAVVIFNTRELPLKINSGDIDMQLIKPINSQFLLTLGRPYFPSLLSTIAGFVLIVYAYNLLNIVPDLAALLGSITFFISGMIILYSFLTIIATFSFYFPDSNFIPKIGERFIYSFTGRPHTIYSGFVKFILFFIIPIVYVSSFSASALINGPEMKYLLFSVGISMTFLIASILFWNYSIKKYSSASS